MKKCPKCGKVWTELEMCVECYIKKEEEKKNDRRKNDKLY